MSSSAVPSNLSQTNSQRYIDFSELKDQKLFSLKDLPPFKTQGSTYW